MPGIDPSPPLTPPRLDDPSLLQGRCLVGGAWIEADDRSVDPVTDPADGTAIATVPHMGATETRRAIDAAASALPAWRAATARERAVTLRRWYDLLLRHQEDLARIMTAEQGKPLTESRGEIAYAASFLEWFAEEAKRVYGDVIPAPQGDRRIVVLKEPVGVVACITPWNFPAAMITRKVGPALAAGCPVVLKPAPETPLSALALGELALRAGVPPGVFNVVTGDAEAIGREMTGSPIVRKISFTGSTEVGKLLMSQSAGTVKRVSLELGGHAPFIVFDDADLEAAVAGAVASKYRNSGQTCICANRFYVQESVHDAFAERLAEEVGRLAVGRGTEPGVEQGPLINGEALAKVEAHVDDAVARGARVLVGGRRHALGGTFYEPTVLTGAAPGMRLAREETFGPVAALFSFNSDDDVVAAANDTRYGLAAYFYARDIRRIWRTAEALEYGIVGINTGLVSTETAPFGGMKESGLGREGSKYGIDEFVEVKYLCLGGL